jgi:hypothetical protein
MTVKDEAEDLREYLQEARDALVWKLDGLSEDNLNLSDGDVSWEDHRRRVEEAARQA